MCAMPTLSAAGDSQRKSSPLNHSQREMPFMAPVRGVTDAPDHLIGLCKTGHEAVQLCIQLSRLPNQEVCDQLGIDKGHWSRIMQGQAHFPTSKRIALMRVCGNRAPLQYEAEQMGMRLVPMRDDERIAVLEA